MTEKQKEWIGFFAKLASIAGALIGTATVLATIWGFAYSRVTGPFQAQFAKERIERIQEDERIAEVIDNHLQYIRLNTERLDAIGILLTADPSSRSYKAAEQDLEDMRTARARLDGPTSMQKHP